MNKALYRKLVRMARDGDAEAIEAVAEIVETLTEVGEPVAPGIEGMPAPVVAAPEGANIVTGYPVAPTPVMGAAPVVAAVPVSAADPVVPAVPADPAAVVTVPEGHEVTIDSDLGAAILQRLDQLIGLLSPAGMDEEPEEGSVAAAEDPVQEIVEAVTEAVEAGAAAEESVEPAAAEVIAEPVAEEIAQIIEAVLEPSEVIDPEEENDECGDPEQQARTADAVRAALKVVRPALAKLPKEKRAKTCVDIAARIRKSVGDSRKRSGTPAGVYAALARASAKDRRTDPAELGRRIMAARNPHYAHR